MEPPFLQLLFQSHEGKGLPFQPYSVELPDGTVAEGHTDEDGAARIESAKAGTCKVRFSGWLAQDFAEDVEAFDVVEADAPSVEDQAPSKRR